MEKDLRVYRNSILKNCGVEFLFYKKGLMHFGKIRFLRYEFNFGVVPIDFGFVGECDRFWVYVEEVPVIFAVVSEVDVTE